MNPRRRFIEKGNSLYRQDLKRFSSSQETERRQPKINLFSIANEETFTINRSTESSPLAFLKQVCTHRAACIRLPQNNGDDTPLHRCCVCRETNCQGWSWKGCFQREHWCRLHLAWSQNDHAFALIQRTDGLIWTVGTVHRHWREDS